MNFHEALLGYSISRTGSVAGTVYRWTNVADGVAMVEVMGAGARFSPFGRVEFDPTSDPVGVHTVRGAVALGN